MTCLLIFFIRISNNLSRQLLTKQERLQRKRDNAHEWQRRQRTELVEFLGGRCQNSKCLVVGGCRDLRCLHVDHKDGYGNEDRRRFKNNYTMYGYYNRNREEAVVKLQLLCANCNYIKRHDNKECVIIPLLF